MRGNLTGKVALQYAEHNNPAFYAPEGKQFARNYGPSYIGNKRASDGHKYFTVKTKSATKIDAATLLQMAVFGATGAIIGSMYSQKSKTPFINSNAVYVLLKQADPTFGSYRSWLSNLLNEGLRAKTQRISASAQTAAGVTVSFAINNPFEMPNQTQGAEVAISVLVKFWLQLASDAVKYHVDGANQPLIGRETQPFDVMIATDINILNLETRSEDTETVIGRTVGGSFQYLNVRDAAGVVGHDYTVLANDQIGLQSGNSYYFGDTYLPQGD